MGQSGTDFQLLSNSKSSKLLPVVLKNMLKIAISNKEKGPFFSNFALVSHFSITRFDILIFCNIIYLEMNFGIFY